MKILKRIWMSFWTIVMSLTGMPVVAIWRSMRDIWSGNWDDLSWGKLW